MPFPLAGIKGGAPVVVDGQIIGGVGVGGGTGEQDAKFAKAGMHALLRCGEREEVRRAGIAVTTCTFV